MPKRSHKKKLVLEPSAPKRSHKQKLVLQPSPYSCRSLLFNKKTGTALEPRYQRLCQPIRNKSKHLTGSNCATTLQTNVCALKHFMKKIERSIKLPDDHEEKESAVNEWIQHLRGIRNMETIVSEVRRKGDEDHIDQRRKRGRLEED